MNGQVCDVRTRDKGFFFIQGEDSQQYFAHRSQLLNSLWIYDIEVGDAVQFDPTRHDKGPRAEQIIVNRLNV